MVELVRHRQPKGTANGLALPAALRHISTLQNSGRRGESLDDQFEQPSGREVGGQSQHRSSLRAGEDSRATEQFIAQGVDAAQYMECGAFEGTASRLRSSRELEASDEVVGEHRQDVPGAIRGEATAGHGVEGVAALELSQNFLLGTASPHEV